MLHRRRSACFNKLEGICRPARHAEHRAIMTCAAMTVICHIKAKSAWNCSWNINIQEAWASGRWSPMHDDRHDPGWMMPLVILSKVYTTYLSTFGDDYMYQQQKPLPLSELYSPKSNEGLISLLKFGLWQVRAPLPY